jgi:16S rRNA (uracil1498-N3)-methyltransferase
MHRHFLDTQRLCSGSSIVLARDEARHLQTVLRARTGEAVELFDGQGRTAAARVAATDRRGLRLELAGAPACHAPPACQLVLFACVSKGRRMDWTVEKAVELGVSRIVPVLSERAVVRLDEDAADSKGDRWTRVAIEAARQSRAVWLPEIHPPVPLPQTAAWVRSSAPVFVAALTPEARPLRRVLDDLRAREGGQTPATAGWFVGPEGDFTPAELRLLLDHGAIPVSLGGQVLRAETAALWGLCVLGAEWLTPEG